MGLIGGFIAFLDFFIGNVAIPSIQGGLGVGAPETQLVMVGYGAALAIVSLAAVVLPLLEGRGQGWPLWVWASLIAAVPLFALFVAHPSRGDMERRIAGSKTRREAIRHPASVA
ncbi:hypothetical protein AB0A70_17080 [Streptomyces morookaense]|uniref:hypothetical protein n=1 Tax=Streptomyces morookaense TaxID=1970 RepID=UPI0033F8B2BC